MGLLHRAHTAYFTISPKPWSVGHQRQSSGVWVYLHCAVEKDTRRAARQNHCIHLHQRDPWPLCWCLPSCIQVQADHQLWYRAWSGLRWRTQTQMSKTKPSTAGAAARRDFVSHKPLRNVLSSTADRACWQRFSATTLTQLRAGPFTKGKGALSKATEKNYCTSFFTSAKVRKNSSWISLVYSKYFNMYKLPQHTIIHMNGWLSCGVQNTG